MPTYDFKCATCGRVTSTFLGISEYSSSPPVLVCHSTPMERFFTSPTCPLLDALASDRIYQDLKAPDGTDISSRAKHRAYMKERGLTTADDFTETWKQAAQERSKAMEGHDPTRTADLARAWESHRG